MNAPLSSEKALLRAAALCSRSEQCVHDMTEKLLRWGLERDAAQEVVARLVSERFIDDARYARAYVHDKFLYNGWGPVKIEMTLRQKGIDDETIAQALSTLQQEQIQAALLRLLEAKHRNTKGRDRRLQRAALLRFAASRGYDMAMCYRCVDQVMQHDDDD